MKYSTLFLLSLLLTTVNLLHSQSEILIVGTAHAVPAGMENNYEPIFNLVSGWDPEVICTEYIKPLDSISYIKTYGDNYFAQQDSIAQSWNIDLSSSQKNIDMLFKKLAEKEDLKTRMELRNHLLVTNDKGNARFQAYQIISEYEKLSNIEQKEFVSQFPMYPEMSAYEKRKTTDEFVLVEFPLAMKNGIEYLHPTDDQSLRDLYHDAWGKSNEELQGTPIQSEFEVFLSDLNNEMEEKIQEGSMITTINDREHQQKLYQLEYSFVPAGFNINRDLMNHYYMDRNFRMAKHILAVAEKNPGKKIVVFYGASHVPFVQRILRSESNHRILTLPDVQG